jgi:hypothetical protein
LPRHGVVVSGNKSGDSIIGVLRTDHEVVRAVLRIAPFVVPDNEIADTVLARRRPRLVPDVYIHAAEHDAVVAIDRRPLDLVETLGQRRDRIILAVDRFLKRIDFVFEIVLLCFRQSPASLLDTTFRLLTGGFVSRPSVGGITRRRYVELLEFAFKRGVKLLSDLSFKALANDRFDRFRSFSVSPLRVEAVRDGVQKRTERTTRLFVGRVHLSGHSKGLLITGCRVRIGLTRIRLGREPL